MWKAITKYAKQGGQFWAELELMPDAQQLWDYIKNYDTEILTAAGNPEYHAAEQKHVWFPKKFGAGTKLNIVRMSKEKASLAAQHKQRCFTLSKQCLAGWHRF